jgi:hypothetical protein
MPQCFIRIKTDPTPIPCLTTVVNYINKREEDTPKIIQSYKFDKKTYVDTYIFLLKINNFKASALGTLHVHE